MSRGEAVRQDAVCDTETSGLLFVHVSEVRLLHIVCISANY
jgi:hypothetical protein